MNPPAEPDQRKELHNVSVDEEVAEAGACAQVHVPTGRTCILRHHHSGSCEFVPRDEAKRSVTQHPTAGGP